MEGLESLVDSIRHGYDLDELNNESILERIASDLSMMKEDNEGIDIVNDRNAIKIIVEDHIEEIIDEIIKVYDQIS